jgi:hypothetical protein
MAVKIFCGIIAMVLMIGYNAVAVIKLQETPLLIVVLIGIGMMAWDLWDSIKTED